MTEMNNDMIERKLNWIATVAGDIFAFTMFLYLRTWKEFGHDTAFWFVPLLVCFALSGYLRYEYSKIR